MKSPLQTNLWAICHFIKDLKFAPKDTLSVITVSKVRIALDQLKEDLGFLFLVKGSTFPG